MPVRHLRFLEVGRVQLVVAMLLSSFFQRAKQRNCPFCTILSCPVVCMRTFGHVDVRIEMVGDVFVAAF